MSKFRFLNLGRLDDRAKAAYEIAGAALSKIIKSEAVTPLINTVVDVDIPYKAKNAEAPLVVPTAPEGEQQPTHPSVVYFPDGWNGWRYWMAHTPFPFGSGDEENPHIVVSQDGITWEEPEGIVNPIFPQPTKGFYSDVDLVYHPGEDRLYLFWRYVEASWTVENILVSSSGDGINWSPKRNTLVDAKWMLSPSIVYDGDTWHMWYAGAPDIMKPIQEQEITVKYRNAKSPNGPWSEPNDTNMVGKFLRNNDIGVWHLDVNKYDGIYYMLIMSDNNDLYLATSIDGIKWSYNKMNPILRKSGVGSGKFDSSKIYRSSGWLVREGSSYRYKIWYGATDDNNRWSIGYTELPLGSSAVMRPRKSTEPALRLEGRTDQAGPVLEIDAQKGAQKAFVLSLSGKEYLVYELGKGIQLPNENDHVLVGSETGAKGRFVANAGVVYLQAGKSSSDVEATVRIARYLSTANIKSFEVFADASLFKGDIEIDNSAKGVILKSPDGSRWRVQIGNDGVLATAKL